MRDSRARLTIGDLVVVGATLVASAGLLVAILRLLDARAGMLGTGTGYLLQLLVPAFMLTILYVIWSVATVGVR